MIDERFRFLYEFIEKQCALSLISLSYLIPETDVKTMISSTLDITWLRKKIIEEESNIYVVIKQWNIKQLCVFERY
jgi:hypothetical protein